MAENKQRQKLIHLHTPDVKVPSQGLLDLGEIAVQHNNDEAALYIKKNDGTIAKFIDGSAVDAKIKVETDRAKTAEGALDAKIATETTRAQGAEDALANRINTLEGSGHTHANKTVLDGITTQKVDKWDAAETNAKGYADSLAVNYDASGAAATVKSDVIGTDGDNKEKDTIKGAKKYAADAAATVKSDVIGTDGDNKEKDTIKGAKKYADSAKSDVIGTDGDNKEKDTIKGAKKYADSAAATVKSDVIGTDGDDKDSLTIKGAKKYADVLNTAMARRVVVLEASSHTHTNKEVLNGITKEKVDAWDAAEANAISSAETYTDNTIAALKLADTYAKKSVVETLVGEDANKSARNIAAEEVAKVVADAPENFDTLKEIADWISSDTTGSAQMANDIKALKAISADTRLTTLEAINADTRLETLEAISAATRLGTLEAISADTRLETLEAISAATRLGTLEKASHTHNNKKVLDGITDKKVEAWDTAKADAISSANTYTDNKIAVLRIDCGTY